MPLERLARKLQWHWRIVARARVRRVSADRKEATIRKFTVSLVGAVALVATGLALLRQNGNRADASDAVADRTPPGETVPGEIRLEKLRELGI